MELSNLQRLGAIEFPAFTGLAANMMPFVIGDPDSVPAPFSTYWPLIEACDVEPEEHGRIGYLSITESVVTPGSAQRRPGIHTEAIQRGEWGGGWGKGIWGSERRRQGLYMASDRDASCRAWDLAVEPGTVREGNESMRPWLEEQPATVMEASRLYWMTDRCPHESLPLANGGPRRWFRFVTSPVDLWFRAHSTANPLGVKPTAKVIEGSKF